MAEFTPEDGVVFFAWRNTFCRVNEQTYDWLYRRDDIVVDGGYVVQEVPYQEGQFDVRWIRLIHERTFSNAERVRLYCAKMQRLYAQLRDYAGAPLRVEVMSAKSPQPYLMHYDGSALRLPAPSHVDAHEDPTGDAINRERFIAQRWVEGQRHWPIAEHHVLHELAHHFAGVESHDEDFVEAFRILLGLASRDKNFNADMWDCETVIARRLLLSGDGAVDMVTQRAYDIKGAEIATLAGLEPDRISA